MKKKIEIEIKVFLPCDKFYFCFVNVKLNQPINTPDRRISTNG